MAAASCIIPANPDIAGIGMRVAVYIQAASALIPATLKIMEDKFREKALPSHLRTKFHKTVVNWENIEEVARPNIFLGVALFISSVIQAHVYGLTVYHALILLNLHIIIGFSVAPYFILSGNDENNPDSIIDGMSPAYVRLALFHIVHLSCAAGFGLWMFASINHFDHSSPSCTNSTIYFAVGKQLAVTSHGFRDFWIAIYAILVIPYLNSAILLVVSLCFYPIVIVPLMIPAFIIGIILGLTHWCTHITQGGVELISLFVTISLVSLAPGALMVFLTEAMVKTNHVSAGENVWTFGQTIAILIAILPLWRVLKQTMATISRIQSGDTEPGPTVYHEEWPRTTRRPGAY